MGEKYGCESTKNITTIRSARDIVLEVESSAGTISRIVNGVTVSSSAAGIDSTKTHTGYAGSDTFVKTAAVTTTDATATNIFSIPVPLSTTVGVWVQTVAKKVGATADGLVSFKYNGCTNAAGTVAVLGTTGGSDLEVGAGTPTVTIVANDTADTLEVKVTGIAAETWAWVSRITYMQVTSST